VAARKAFLLRIDPAVWAAVESWAAQDLRSVNAQVEFLLREALRRAGRTVRKGAAAAGGDPATTGDPARAPAAGDPAGDDDGGSAATG